MPETSFIQYSDWKNLLLNPDYPEFIRIFPSFASVFHYEKGKTVKKIKGRDVLRIPVSGKNPASAFYVKRHFLSFAGLRRLMRLFFPRRFSSEGRKEFYHICAFRKQGLATVDAVAAGERHRWFFWEESFVITADFHPFESLENLLLHHAGFRKRMEDPEEKKKLLREIMKYARKMHDAGLNHSDFNADHILIRYDQENSAPEIALYDLQRVRQNTYFRFRWIVKSIAELTFSLPHDFLREKERTELLLYYKGKEKTGVRDKIQLFWIRKKMERIQKHTEKIMKRHSQNKDILGDDGEKISRTLRAAGNAGK